MLKKKNKGFLIVISSPSGAGKSSLSKKIVSKKSNIELSVSLTTRAPRISEFNGIDYEFVSLKKFKKEIKKNSFLEHAKVFDNYYGTLKKNVLKKINSGINVLLDIDWQGARQVKKILPNETLSIFILPPSIKELKNRLMKRKHDNEFIMKRMSKAKQEIIHWKEYDYAVVNDNFKKCLKTIKNIISLEIHRPFRQRIQKY